MSEEITPGEPGGRDPDDGAAEPGPRNELAELTALARGLVAAAEPDP
jgi:hypothetical protein